SRPRSICLPALRTAFRTFPNYLSSSPFEDRQARRPVRVKQARPACQFVPRETRRLCTRLCGFHVEQTVSTGAFPNSSFGLSFTHPIGFKLSFKNMLFPERFEVIVVGGGHAGTEAALAAARTGRRTLLLTHSIETLGQMSCNPSIGGIGKGHLVKEVDALGGAMALATDKAGIQFRMLNASKGPAVRATRAQADRVLYRRAIRSILENQPNLTLFQQPVDDVLVTAAKATGVVTQGGIRFDAQAVVLTTGTFLSGL